MRLLNAGVYSQHESLKDNMLEAGVLELRKLIKIWYSNQHRLYPEKPQSKIDALSVAMFGRF